MRLSTCMVVATVSLQLAHQMRPPMMAGWARMRSIATSRRAGAKTSSSKYSMGRSVHGTKVICGPTLVPSLIFLGQGTVATALRWAVP